MDQNEFLRKKREIDRAAFLRNKNVLQSSYESLETHLKDKTMEPEMKIQVDSLKQKIVNTLQSIDEEIKADEDSYSKPLSLRTRARNSLLNLSQEPTEKFLTYEKQEMDRYALIYCLDNLDLPIHPALGKAVYSAIQQVVAKEEKTEGLTIQHIEESMIEHLLEIKNTLNQTPLDYQWNYEMHSFASKGTRDKMEDFVSIIPCISEFMNIEHNEPILFCGLYDGHGGSLAALYARAHLHHNILNNPSFPSDIPKAITEGFVQTDKECKNKFSKVSEKSGTTATIALIIGNQLYVANVGDSSAVFKKESEQQPVFVTFNHKAEEESEKKRITSQGGIVVFYGGGFRVSGSLAVSRSIGDYSYGDVVIAEPHIFHKTLEESDEYVVLASDGLWDVVNQQEVSNTISTQFSNTSSESTNVAKLLVEQAMKKNTLDNTSVIFISLKSKGTGNRKDRW